MKTAEPVERKSKFCAQNKHNNTIGYFNVAKEYSSEGIEPFKRLDLVSCDCLAVAELSWED